MTVKGWQFTVRLPTWPLAALWCYFGGSVAGNVGHAPPVLAAQLVAAVPPVSAALTFHSLLRLLDRAPALRQIAERYEERSVENENARPCAGPAAPRIKTSVPLPAIGTTPAPRLLGSAVGQMPGNGDSQPTANGHHPGDSRGEHPNRTRPVRISRTPALGSSSARRSRMSFTAECVPPSRPANPSEVRRSANGSDYPHAPAGAVSRHCSTSTRSFARSSAGTSAASGCRHHEVETVGLQAP